MSRWPDLPPGCTPHDIDRAAGAYEEEEGTVEEKVVENMTADEKERMLRALVKDASPSTIVAAIMMEKITPEVNDIVERLGAN